MAEEFGTLTLAGKRTYTQVNATNLATDQRFFFGEATAVPLYSPIDLECVSPLNRTRLRKE